MPAFFFLKASTVYYPTCAPPRRRAPRRASFLQAGRSGPRLLSGKMCRVGEAMGGRFPADALPSHMLPRDLAKLQDLFPTAPTSILQAELQVRVCARACVHAWVAGWGKRRRVVSPRRVQCTQRQMHKQRLTGAAFRSPGDGLGAVRDGHADDGQDPPGGAGPRPRARRAARVPRQERPRRAQLHAQVPVAQLVAQSFDPLLHRC